MDRVLTPNGTLSLEDAEGVLNITKPLVFDEVSGVYGQMY
jgi:hypothetical protein